MHATTSPQPLIDILTAILLFATRILRDIARTVAANDTLRTIFTAQEAGSRIARVVRLTTLLIRRIQIHGLHPLTPTRPRTPSATTKPATPRTQPRLQSADGDAAFIRRPIPTIVAAITRELHLAAQAMGIPLPDHLQTLCLHAAIASAPLDPAGLDKTGLDTTGLDTPEPQTQPSNPPPPNPEHHGWTETPAPTPTKTLEL